MSAAVCSSGVVRVLGRTSGLRLGVTSSLAASAKWLVGGSLRGVEAQHPLGGLRQLGSGRGRGLGSSQLAANRQLDPGCSSPASGSSGARLRQPPLLALREEILFLNYVRL